ncbi:hypothetical protein HanIR_Chr04g0180641 [Helianthus annuus]|nr:hypothetical protein HanIR_Chr04g0180641 [Helianthus annuus]
MFLRVERIERVRVLHACRMEETQSVSSYVFKMKSHIDRLERLNMGKRALSILTINEGGNKKGHHPDTKANVANENGKFKGKKKRKTKAKPLKPKEKKAKVAMGR